MSTRIKVGVRIRPLLDNEQKSGYKNTRVSIDRDRREILVSNPQENGLNVRRFEFDHVFSETAAQPDVFEECEVGQMVDHLLEGYHSTIFAYGQTGSGKTHTMEGFEYEVKDDRPRPKTEQTPDRFGIVPRTVMNLFSQIKQRSTTRQYSVYISFLQIYNEKIFDLLNPTSLQFQQSSNLTTPTPDNSIPVGGLRLRWNQRDQFTVENLFIFQCKTAQEVIEFYQYGIKNRVTASHRLNMASSRSHTIMTIKVESIDLQNADSFYSSKLELVDLAGSQRIGQTGTEGKLAKESIDINKSLFILRQVITTLADANKNKGGGNGSSNNVNNNFVHIPYRESKLTSLLKQSIGGNSYCLMIACITPCDFFVDENLSTLNYATKATYIQNDPIKNDDPRNQLIAELRTQILQLKSELDQANQHISLITQLNGGETALKDKLERQQQMESGSTGQKVNTLGNDQDSQVSTANSKKSSSDYSNGGRHGTPVNGGNSAQNTRVVTQGQQEPMMNLGLDYEQFSDRLIESIQMVRELLQSNKQLRETTENSKRKADICERELTQLQCQNQDLRDQLMQFDFSPTYNSNNRSDSPTVHTVSGGTGNGGGISEDEQEYNSSPHLYETRGNLVASAGNAEVMDFQQMTHNQLISEILNLRRDKKLIERKLKSQDLERSRSINMGGKADASQTTLQNMNNTNNSNNNPSIMPLKEVENNVNGVDSLPTNFGRKTFYQSLNGSVNQQIHQQMIQQQQQQQQNQNYQFSSLQNDISKEIHINPMSGHNTRDHNSTVSPKALLGNIVKPSSITYNTNHLNNTNPNNYYKQPIYTPTRQIQMPAIDDNIKIGEITRYSINTGQARSNSLNQGNGMYNQNIVIAPQQQPFNNNNSAIKNNNLYTSSYY